jgi:hypothetical protein
LKPAIDEGFIAPLSGLESADPNALEAPLVYGRFAFLPRPRAASGLATLSRPTKPALHLAIGRALLSGVSAALLESRLFDVVNHLNHGIALIGDPVSASGSRSSTSGGREGRAMRRLTTSRALFPARDRAAR